MVYRGRKGSWDPPRPIRCRDARPPGREEQPRPCPLPTPRRAPTAERDGKASGSPCPAPAAENRHGYGPRSLTGAGPKGGAGDALGAFCAQHRCVRAQNQSRTHTRERFRRAGSHPAPPPTALINFVLPPPSPALSVRRRSRLSPGKIGHGA